MSSSGSDASYQERKRSHRERSSSSESTSSERAINELPTLTWNKVDKKTGSSGIPPLNEDYLRELEKMDEDKAIRKAMKKDGLLEAEEVPKKRGPFTLNLNFKYMKDTFKDVDKWCTEKSQPTNRDKSLIVVVDKWPEPEFIEEEDLFRQGKSSTIEKRRWHHRSKNEAVYERKADQFNMERERRKRMTEMSRPINPNMEAIGQRIKSEPGRPQENMLPNDMDRNSRGSFERTPRRSPSRDQRDGRSERKEVEHRRYDERQVGRDNGYNYRGDKRQERHGYDRYSRGEDKENIRDRSPRGHGDNGNRDRSPKARHDDRGRRSPPAKKMSMNDSHGSRDGGYNSSSASRREDYENEYRRARTSGTDGYIKQEH